MALIGGPLLSISLHSLAGRYADGCQTVLYWYRAFADERVRLLWDNLPVWFGLRRISALLAGNGFNVVCSTCAGARANAGAMVDPADRLKSFMENFT